MSRVLNSKLVVQVVPVVSLFSARAKARDVVEGAGGTRARGGSSRGGLGSIDRDRLEC